METGSSLASRERQPGQIHDEGKAEGSNYQADLVTKTLSVMKLGLSPSNVCSTNADSIGNACVATVKDHLKELSEVFSQSDGETQSEIISEILSNPKNLQLYYRFADKLYKGGSGLHSIDCSIDHGEEGLETHIGSCIDVMLNP